MKKRFPLILLPILLSGCTPISPDNLQDGEDYSHVGLDIQWIEEQEAVDEIKPETIDAVNELQQSYDAAIVVRDLMLEINANMSEEDRKTMSAALDAFSADIEALKYFVDTATYDELTDEEQSDLIKISAGIEEGMAVFGDILEVLL